MKNSFLFNEQIYHHNHVLVHFIASVTENLGLKKKVVLKLDLDLIFI